MKELEEERQIFLEECKKSKTKTIIISSIGAIIFVVILMLYNVHHVYGDFSGFTNTGFTMFNEGDSILDYTKIYFFGWYLDQDYTTPFERYNNEDTLTIYAKWITNVTFHVYDENNKQNGTYKTFTVKLQELVETGNP